MTARELFKELDSMYRFTEAWDSGEAWDCFVADAKQAVWHYFGRVSDETIYRIADWFGVEDYIRMAY